MTVNFHAAKRSAPDHESYLTLRPVPLLGRGIVALRQKAVGQRVAGLVEASEPFDHVLRGQRLHERLGGNGWHVHLRCDGA